MNFASARRLPYLLLLMIGLQLSACSENGNPEGGRPAPATSTSGSSVPAAVPSFKLKTFGVGNSVYVRSLATEAASNALWVGTSAGVHEIDLDKQEVKQTFTRDHGLANEYVFGIAVDQRGYKWFGTNAGGVSRFKDGEWKTFFPMHGLADYWVYSFATQNDDELWIGTWAGVNHVNLNTEKFTTYVKELVNEWVYAIQVDKENRVWFGTEGGVSMFDGTTWQSWTHDDGLGASNERDLPASPNTGLGTRKRHDLGILAGGEPTYNPNYVFSMLADDLDRIWAGTWGGGVSMFDGDKWISYSTKDGLAGNIVYSMIKASDGAYWFGTNGGVTRYDGASWTNFGVQHGMAANDVYTLAEDPKGGIWAGTRGGVTVFTR